MCRDKHHRVGRHRVYAPLSVPGTGQETSLVTKSRERLKESL